jgi:uncharacterized protein YjbI with pentapeptide repeats
MNGVRLSRSKLLRANLRGSRFDPVPQRDAKGQKTGLVWKADLREADFRGADLRHAVLLGAKIEGATFAGANMSGADLRGCDMDAADFAGADLAGARLGKSKSKRVGIAPKAVSKP